MKQMILFILERDAAFISEMDKTRSEVKRATGITLKIIRFPSGSKPYLNKAFWAKLHRNSFKVYDWNSALSDGLNYKLSSSELKKEATRFYNQERIYLF